MTILSDWALFFPILNGGILVWVVWRLLHQPTPPLVTHCLITRQAECLLLRQPTILCDACRAAVMARAHESKARELT